jgi:hypothetical protein
MSSLRKQQIFHIQTRIHSDELLPYLNLQQYNVTCLGLAGVQDIVQIIQKSHGVFISHILLLKPGHNIKQNREDRRAYNAMDGCHLKHIRADGQQWQLS